LANQSTSKVDRLRPKDGTWCTKEAGQRGQPQDGDALDHFAIGLGQMGRIWRSYQEKVLKPLGISLVQWQVLHFLSQDAGDVDSDEARPVVQRELALAVGVDEPVLVGVLDRLETAGLVVRRSAAHDRRAKTVHLTSKAGGTLDKAELELRKMREGLLHGLEVDDLEAAAHMFTVITGRLLDAAARMREATASEAQK
jgi:MarR family transcriptional regulator for hemolysin